MTLNDTFTKLQYSELLGPIVAEINVMREKNNFPEPNLEGPTTRAYMDQIYWTEYEPDSEIWALYYNDLIDDLLSLIDVFNVSDSRTNPVWYTHYHADEGFDQYSDQVNELLNERLQYLYEKVCSIDEQELLEMGYEYSEPEEDE